MHAKYGATSDKHMPPVGRSYSQNGRYLTAMGWFEWLNSGVQRMTNVDPTVNGETYRLVFLIFFSSNYHLQVTAMNSKSYPTRAPKCYRDTIYTRLLV